MTQKRPNVFDFEEAKAQQIEDYAVRREVPGLADVDRGLRVSFPTTIYNIAGNDTSGVAGVLMPSGEFIAALPRRVGTPQRFWEFDETLKYERVPGQVTPEGTPRVIGNSWTEGEVVWDGAVTGSVVEALDGEEGDEERNVVLRREWEASISGEWESTGELWRAMERGTRMKGGPTPGRIHTTDSGTVLANRNKFRGHWAA